MWVGYRLRDGSRAPRYSHIMTAAANFSVRSCPCCGLAHRVPVVSHQFRAVCTRCRTTLASPARSARSISRTAAFACAALVLYPAAMLLPVMRIEQFGHAQATSILGGTIDLLAHGHVGIGLVILICSVVVPIAKLMTLLTLTGMPGALRHHHRALAHHLLEWTGRWGMLDVLAVAVVVAALKLGDMVEVTPGSGAVAFAGVVALSLLASASFNPHLAWERADGPAGARKNPHPGPLPRGEGA